MRRWVQDIIHTHRGRYGGLQCVCGYPNASSIPSAAVLCISGRTWP